MTGRKIINEHFNKLFNTQFNYFTPEGFFILWEWANKQEWFDEDVGEEFLLRYDCKNREYFDIENINPEIFANKLFNFITTEIQNDIIRTEK